LLLNTIKKHPVIGRSAVRGTTYVHHEEKPLHNALGAFNGRSRPPLLKSPTGILSGGSSGVNLSPYVQADALSPWHLLSLLKWQKLGNIPVSIIAFDY